MANELIMSSLPKITTLKQFINILYQGTGYESYANLLQSIDFGAKEVEPLCFWNPEEYSRISIDKGDSFRDKLKTFLLNIVSPRDINFKVDVDPFIFF